MHPSDIYTSRKHSFKLTAHQPTTKPTPFQLPKKRIENFNYTYISYTCPICDKFKNKKNQTCTG